MNGYAYGDYAQRKPKDYEENDTYIPYKKDNNYDYYGKNHKYTYDDNEESTLATFFIRNPTTIRRRRIHALQKEKYYDRRHQRVAPRSLLPDDLFRNSECISGPWAMVSGSCNDGCPSSAYFYQLRATK